MLSYDFMQHAFIAGTFIAITCGLMGVFVVARQMAFLAHTLSEIGFAGASFALFMGISPLSGMLWFTILSALTVGRLSIQADYQEASISVTSSLFVGLGILFLSLSNQSSSEATNILFGSIISISASEVVELLILCLIVILIVFSIFRKLSFTSFDLVGAKAQRLPIGGLNIIFLLLLALSVSVAAQIVGSLLVFILMTLPAFTAKFLGKTIWQMVIIAIGCALLGVWLGLYLGFVTSWPVTFFIAIIECLCYLIARVSQKDK